MIVLNTFWILLVITLSAWATPLRKRNGAHVVKHGIRIYTCVYIYIYMICMLLLLGIPPKLFFYPCSKCGQPGLVYKQNATRARLEMF